MSSDRNCRHGRSGEHEDDYDVPGGDPVTMSTVGPPSVTPAGDYFDEKVPVRYGVASHSPICWSHHPVCAYRAGRNEAAALIEAAAEHAATTSRDFGRGFAEAAKIARRG